MMDEFQGWYDRWVNSSMSRMSNLEIRKKFRPEQHRSERRGPVMEPNMEASERLLKQAIERIESGNEVNNFWTFDRPCLNQQRDLQFKRGLSSYQFHPKSITLRNNAILLDFIVFMFRMTSVLALDRLMKRAEKNDKLRELLAGIVASLECRCFFLGISDLVVRYNLVGTILRRESWRLERIMVLLSDPATSASELDHVRFNEVVSAVIHLLLLCFVFQYLIGYVDRGGSKTYSSGSFDFRATFVAIVLFQGAYVWIKFRQAAATPGSRKRKAASYSQPDMPGVQVGDAIPVSHIKGIYARPIRDKNSGVITHYKYEPRFKPKREKAHDGTSLKLDRLSLGGYNTPAEAKIVLQIARFYYDKLDEDVQYLDSIPPMSEQERRFSGEAKSKWVAGKAKEVGEQIYAEFQKQSDVATKTGAQIAGHGSAVGSSPSCSLPLPPCDIGKLGVCADDSSAWTLSDGEAMVAELYYPGQPNVPPQESSLGLTYQMHYQAFAQIVGDGSSPQVDAVLQDTEHDLEPQLSPSRNFQQLGRDLVDAVPPNIDASGSSLVVQQSDPAVLQKLVHCQKKQLEGNAIQFVDFDHQPKVSQIQISELQQKNERLQQEKQQEKELFEQEKERLRQENERLHQENERLQQEKEFLEQEKERLHQENERLKSRLQQVAKLISSYNLEGNHD